MRLANATDLYGGALMPTQRYKKSEKQESERRASCIIHSSILLIYLDQSHAYLVFSCDLSLKSRYQGASLVISVLPTLTSPRINTQP